MKRKSLLGGVAYARTPKSEPLPGEAGGNEVRRHVEVGGRLIGTVIHTAPRTYYFVGFYDAADTPYRGPYHTGVEAEKHMVNEWSDVHYRRGLNEGLKAGRVALEDELAQLRIDREELDADREELAEKAEIFIPEALDRFTIEELSSALIRQWPQERKRIADEDMEKLCDGLWKALGNELQQAIDEPTRVQLCLDLGRKVWGDADSEDEIREIITDETLDHPAIVELRWAARATSQAEKDDCIRKALFELSLD